MQDKIMKLNFYLKGVFKILFMRVSFKNNNFRFTGVSYSIFVLFPS